MPAPISAAHLVYLQVFCAEVETLDAKKTKRKKLPNGKNTSLIKDTRTFIELSQFKIKSNILVEIVLFLIERKTILSK